jgi:hypothetical protein
MRPNVTLWSDYRSPKQTHWRSPYRRRTRSSIGPKILVVAGGVVAGIIGISGIYPQIIDADWVQSAGTDTPHSENVANGATTTRRSGIVAAIPLPPRRVAMTTGEAAVPAPRPAAPTPASAPEPEPELSEMGSSVAAVELPPSETAPPLADIPDAQAKADPPAEPAVAPAARTKPVGRLVEGLRAPVRQRVLRVVHHRSYSGAYAQYGGWGGWGGGWGRF